MKKNNMEKIVSMYYVMRKLILRKINYSVLIRIFNSVVDVLNNTKKGSFVNIVNKYMMKKDQKTKLLMMENNEFSVKVLVKN